MFLIPGFLLQLVIIAVTDLPAPVANSSDGDIQKAHDSTKEKAAQKLLRKLKDYQFQYKAQPHFDIQDVDYFRADDEAPDGHHRDKSKAPHWTALDRTRDKSIHNGVFVPLFDGNYLILPATKICGGKITNFV